MYKDNQEEYRIAVEGKQMRFYLKLWNSNLEVDFHQKKKGTIRVPGRMLIFWDCHSKKRTIPGKPGQVATLEEAQLLTSSDK